MEVVDKIEVEGGGRAREGVGGKRGSADKAGGGRGEIDWRRRCCRGES